MIKSQPSSTEVTYLEDLRKEFIDWKKRMKVTDTELGKGLNISRGTIGKFIKGEEATLNIKRHKIESLFNHVTSEDAIKKIKNGDAQTNRKELRAKTVYYLLKKAGFSEKEERAKLPISSEEDLSLSQRFEKIRFRLSNQSLTNSDVWQIEEMVINQLAQIHSRIENRDDFIKLDRVNEWLQNQYVYAEDYWREVESTLKRYKDLGREKFNKSEVLELFQSIAENQMSRISDIQNIRVIRCEMRTINSVYTRLENKQHGSVLEEISIAGTSAEKVLRGLKEEKSPFTPLNEVKLTCMLGNGGNRKSITWFYRSCSSTMDNMISAIQEGTGHNLKLKDLSSHVLAEGSDSMVRVSAILKNDGGK